jgi:L-ascorbate metabolism protein UlaG (beta-lactamase superfamily)
MNKLNNGVRLTWLGHSTWLIESPNGKRILVDPIIEGNPTCPADYKGEGLSNIDVILCTHGHGDHIGDLVSIAKRTGATVAGIFDLTTWAQGQGVEKTVGGNKGGTFPIAEGIKVTLVTAHHSSSYNGYDMGDPCGFILELENGYKIYNSGDTDVFGDMALIAELYEPDLVMLCIGDYFTMGVKQAAKAIELLNTRLVLPQHYGTFPLLTGTPAALQEAVGDRAEILTMQPGDTLT